MNLSTLKRRYGFALLCAFFTVLLDLFSIPFVYGFTHSLIGYLFLGPALLGERFLLFAREEWGWPIVTEFMTSLSSSWGWFLILLNESFYAALGFSVGLKLGGLLWKKP